MYIFSLKKCKYEYIYYMLTSVSEYIYTSEIIFVLNTICSINIALSPEREQIKRLNKKKKTIYNVTPTIVDFR